MPDTLDLGVIGIEAALGDHICGLYSNQFQRDQILLPFLEAGLAAGDKCICVVDGTDPKEVVAALDTRADAAKFVANNQLEVIRAPDMCMRSGDFSADEVISSWKAAMSDVMYDGRFDVVRAVETWSGREVVPDMDELIMLESEMNRFLPLFPQVVVCLYDIGRFGSGIIVDLLKTHPRMLIGGMLVENPYYTSPDELLHLVERGVSDIADGEIDEAAKWYFDETTGSTLARKVNWTPRYVDERELFPEEVSGHPWLAQEAWRDWNEAYRTTYREYVANQREKDAAVLGVRSALDKPHLFDGLDPGWVQLVKFHNGAVALAEYAGAIAELRMARFGRDSAWRMMSTLGALDEIRHTQIPLLIGHDMLAHDGNFDWTHKAFHTNEWVILAARHLFDDMFLAADAIDSAIQLNFVFETGFTNLQFMAMAAMADRAHHHLFEKTLASIQTDEARHAQIGHPVMRTLLENGFRERAQYLVDKMWWRCWRLFLALTGTAMEYLTPLHARTRSFKEFMNEWVSEQFMNNLAEFDLEKPWFWDLFVEEIDYAHHSFQLGLYTYRTTLWFDIAMPDDAEREWLNANYPDWEATYGPLWDRLERSWETRGEANTLSYGLPALCNLCQLPALFVRPGRNTACTLEMDGRRYLFCSQPCRWSSSKKAPGSRTTRAWSIASWSGRPRASSRICTSGWDSRHRSRPARTCGADWIRGASTPSRRRRSAAVRIYLFGYASDDFLARVIVTPNERTVAQLADQLVAWGLAPERGGPLTVHNEIGDELDPDSTIAAAGLNNGDIFTVERG